MKLEAFVPQQCQISHSEPAELRERLVSYLTEELVSPSRELQSAAPGYVTMSQAHYINDPGHWRARAQETRVLAEDLKDEHARQTMLQLAKEYDYLVERAENRSRGSTSMIDRGAIRVFREAGLQRR